MVDMDVDLVSLQPLEGGHSGETFVGRVAGERVVVRIYAGRSSRGPAAYEVDAALLRLVRGLIPVPSVLEVRGRPPGTDLPALLVTSYLAGMRGDLLLPGLDPGSTARLGAELGRLLADLGGMPMPATGGFVDSTLRIAAFPSAFDGLPELVEASESDLAHLTHDELAGLREVALDAQALLDTVERVCLVHSDVNPKNLLVDPGSLTVTGLIDWEFAYAGHPSCDLGNLLRFERDPVLTEAVLQAYVERRGGTPEQVLALARAADLSALIELSTRRHANPVAASADRLLRTIARHRDPAATP